MSSSGEQAHSIQKRPYISVHFTCCNVYLRIYRSADGKHYRGRCPKCATPVTFCRRRRRHGRAELYSAMNKVR